MNFKCTHRIVRINRALRISERNVRALHPGVSVKGNFKGHQLPQHAYLLKPIQRFKCQLILKEMIKYSQESHDSSASLKNALEGMMKVLKNLNNVMHSTYIRGFLSSLGDEGKLLMQDSFVVWQSNKKHVINMNIMHFKGKPRQVFLYEKLVVFTKRDDEATKDTVYYQSKICLKMIDIGLTETVKEDPLKFGLWLQNKSEFYTLQNNEESTEVIYTAIADYTPFETSELSFMQGDTLQVLRVGGDEWWFARSQRTAQEGWVPGSYLEVVHQDVNSE